MEITNRQILITGASRGIGRVFASMCAENKAYLHLVLRKNDPQLVEELREKGARDVKVYLADLGKREDLETLLQGLNETPIDILFNNAGVLIGGLTEEQSLQEIYEMMQINLNSLIHLTHSLLPGMLSRKRGKIINHSSAAAYVNIPSLSTYSASKAAVSAFTEALQLELKGTGVSTLLLVTPLVKTKMYDDLELVIKGHMKLPVEPLSPIQYVGMIREAILQDLPVLKPTGLTGLGLQANKFVKPFLDFEILRRFKRNK
jgi:short-subunit dehydrogenase